MCDCQFAPSFVPVAEFESDVFRSPETTSIATFSSTLAFASINMSKGWRNSAVRAPYFHEDAASTQLSRRRFSDGTCLSKQIAGSLGEF